MGMEKCTDPMVGGARLITLYDACTPSSGMRLNVKINHKYITRRSVEHGTRTLMVLG